MNAEAAHADDLGGLLAGRVVIVTGGASGIGASTAELVGLAGASVLLADRDERLVASTAERLAAQGIRVETAIVDVSVLSDVEKMVAAALVAFGHVDGLVTSAGTWQEKESLEVAVEEFERMLRVNLTGTFLCATRTARAILDSGGSGSIVTVSSALAFSGRPMRSAYTASKAGVVAMTKSLAAEWGPEGIRVNSVAPGLVDTPLVGNLDTEYRQAYSAQTPLRRVGNAVDVARVARFLLSDEAGYVTGQTILVNGGFLMPS